MKEILNYSLFETEKFNVTVYSIVAVTITIAVGFLLQRLIKVIFNRLVDKNKIDVGTSSSLFQIAKYLLWTLIILSTLESIGVKISILIASAAALLVGIGLGLQQLFNDIASGIILLIEQNLKVRDVIELQDGTVGRVQKIGIRTSKIKTRDDIIMIVPNSKFVNDNIVNWSHVQALTRFNVKVGVAYGSDVNLVKEVLLKCANENPNISMDKQPFVRFESFGESSLDFALFFWIDETFLSEHIKSELRFEIDRLFRENLIQIPFPQRDIHIKSNAN